MFSIPFLPLSPHIPSVLERRLWFTIPCQQVGLKPLPSESWIFQFIFSQMAVDWASVNARLNPNANKPIKSRIMTISLKLPLSLTESIFNHWFCIDNQFNNGKANKASNSIWIMNGWCAFGLSFRSKTHVSRQPKLYGNVKFMKFDYRFRTRAPQLCWQSQITPFITRARYFDVSAN